MTYLFRNMILLLFIGSFSSVFANQCVLYGVQDEGLNDSQFFTLDPLSGETQSLQLHPAADIEALAMDPSTDDLYAASGNDSQTPGVLYKVDKADGALSEIGDTGFNEINSIAFDNVGNLWGWISGQGLYTFNLDDASSTLMIPSDYQGVVEDIAWTHDGEQLLASTETTLFIFSKNGGLDKTCDLPGESEGLEMWTDDWLILGIHQESDMAVRIMDINHCGMMPGEALITGFDDIEGLALPLKACTGGQAVNMDGAVTCFGKTVSFDGVEVDVNQSDSSFSSEFEGSYGGKTIYGIFEGSYENNFLNAVVTGYSDAERTQALISKEFSGSFDEDGKLTATAGSGFLSCSVEVSLAD